MKKIIIVLAVVILGHAVWVSFSWNSVEETSAQVVDSEEQKKLEWDKSVTQEKFELLRQENRAVQDEIKKAVASNYPRLRVRSAYSNDPANAAIGMKGQSSFDISWGNRSAIYSIAVTFVFTSDEAVRLHEFGVSRISLGEFFPAPEFLGKPSVLVKNVKYNKAMTEVGIHFVKGRLVVSGYLKNHKQTALENEKDLIEFIRKVYPAINAKQTFEEV
jgi:hypothetical protein